MGFDLATTLKILGYGAAAGALGATVANAISSRRPFQGAITSDRNLVFPLDLDKYSLSMAFDFIEYKRRSIFAQPYMKPIGTVRLPVAKNIVDKFRATWNPEKADPVVGAAIENILGEMQGKSTDAQSATAIAEAFKSTLSITGGVLAGAGIQGTQSLLEKASGLTGVNLSVDQALQPFGLAINPFLTVMFKQPEFKAHNFSWRLVAREPEESRKINTIINHFKYHMLPDIAQGTGGTLLNYPSMVQIGFFSSDNFLYRFKPCVITDMSVNYAPAATPSFFKGSQNVPTEIELSLTLLEIEYWTKVDMENAMIPGVNITAPIKR